MAIDWSEQEDNYAIQVSEDPYHKLRTNFILRLFPESVKVVVDFGCGEGFFSELMLRRRLAQEIIAIDPSPSLIKIAHQNKFLSEYANCKIRLGNAESLKEFEQSSADLIVALNVLAYMNNVEEDVFYQESNRILKPGGHLLVTHSNELFDLFTLNNLTVDFFKANFNVDIEKHLVLSELTPVQTYKIRENPLSYAIKLSNYGFRQEKMDFFHHHDDLPRDSRSSGRNKVIEESESRESMSPEYWREYFLSSTFGVLAQKL
jgi:ubiquinone/menaquinone biosynthesis C-methylase UbiE